MITEKTKPCDKEECGGTAYYERSCASYVCDGCGTHVGLARCWCGYSRHGSDGRRELLEMGEQIDEQE